MKKKRKRKKKGKKRGKKLIEAEKDINDREVVDKVKKSGKRVGDEDFRKNSEKNTCSQINNGSKS